MEDWYFDDEKVVRKANLTYLQKDKHFTNLQSTFKCSKDHIALLILIKSHPKDLERRETVRKTWGRPTKDNDFVKFFLIGTISHEKTMNLLEMEMEIYSDIVRGQFDDNFYNLPLKAEIGFEWSYKHCSFDYLVETDDDVFLNIPLIISLIKTNQFPLTSIYLGNSKTNDSPVRAGEYPGGEKYIVTLDEYNGTVYPPYCSGGAYILSQDVVEKIVPFLKEKYFKLDDVYIGMLIYNTGVKVTHFQGFYLNQKDCNLVRNAVAHHPAKSESCMQHLYRSL